MRLSDEFVAVLPAEAKRATVREKISALTENAARKVGLKLANGILTDAKIGSHVHVPSGSPYRNRVTAPDYVRVGKKALTEAASSAICCPPSIRSPPSHVTAPSSVVSS